ncbi:MAG: ABC transporter permease [Anaerolineae bacterium]|nr:ABC transporter permease [Anaerolineae bacterium]
MLRKIWLIARREFTYNFRRRSFLFSAFGVPIFVFVLWFFIFGSAEETAEATGTLGDIGYVDLAGFLSDPVEEPEDYVLYADQDAAQAALLAGDIGAYFVISEDYLNTGLVDAYAFQGIPTGIEIQLEDFLDANIVRLAPPGLPIDRLLHPMDVRLVETGTGGEVDGEDALMGEFLSAIVFAMIFLMAVNTTSQFLMSAVVEEKENRMMEILVTSSRPLEMLWGKVLGMGALGLVQIVF